MIAASFEVKGLRELDENLRELDLRIQRKMLRPALRAAAGPILQEAIRGARIAEGGPTYPEIGHMAENIVMSIGIRKTRGAFAKIGPDKEHWYAAFQEFGTPTSLAKPFLRPALDSRGQEAVSIFSNVLGTKIESEADAIGRANK